MKIIVLTILLAAGFAAPALQARECYMPTRKVLACKPVYTCTKVIACRTECRYATNSCGYRYSYEVKVTTYADIYSDGSRNTYTKVYRA